MLPDGEAECGGRVNLRVIACVRAFLGLFLGLLLAIIRLALDVIGYCYFFIGCY